MSKIQTPQSIGDFPLSLVNSMIGLATSGFGVVVALAWNEFIQTSVKTLVDPYLGKNGGLISQLIYAAVITLLAVLVTMQLTAVQSQLETLSQKVRRKPTPIVVVPAKKVKKTARKIKR